LNYHSFTISFRAKIQKRTKLTLLIRALMVYVRPIVEYNSVVWSPHSRHDIDSV